MKRIFRALIIVAVSFAAAGAAFAEDAMVRHRVQPGDTVPRLSWQYKIRADAIRAANGLTGDALTPGTTILIPAGGDVPPPAARRENEVPTAVARPAQAKPALRATTSAQDLRPVAPTKRAAPRDEAEAMPTPYVQDLGARSPQGKLRPRNVPPPPPKAAGNVPRDEPPLDEINAAAAAPRKRVTAPAAVTAPRSDGAVMSDRRNPDFLRLSRQLADQGIPYNGGWTPPGESVSWVMDCSNTCRWLYREGAGIELPRTASDQYLTLDKAGLLWSAPHEFLSSKVNTDKLGRRLKPGDLLFWENTYKPVRRPDITHVMMYLGTDAQGRWRMVGSQTTNGVNIYDFDPTKVKGGYRTFFGLFKHEGRFVAYGRPLGNG